MPILLPPVPTTIMGSYIHASKNTIWSTGYFFYHNSCQRSETFKYRGLTSNFSCFLEPVRVSLSFSTFFSSPLQTPSVFSGGKATAKNVFKKKTYKEMSKQSYICKSVFINRVKLISANLYERIIILDLLFCSLHIWDNFSRQSTNSFWYIASLKNITRVTGSSNTVL